MITTIARKRGIPRSSGISMRKISPASKVASPEMVKSIRNQLKNLLVKEASGPKYREAGFTSPRLKYGSSNETVTRITSRSANRLRRWMYIWSIRSLSGRIFFR